MIRAENILAHIQGILLLFLEALLSSSWDFRLFFLSKIFLPNQCLIACRVILHDVADVAFPKARSLKGLCSTGDSNDCEAVFLLDNTTERAAFCLIRQTLHLRGTAWMKARL